jgi:hypothetical protein
MVYFGTRFRIFGVLVVCVSALRSTYTLSSERPVSCENQELKQGPISFPAAPCWFCRVVLFLVFAVRKKSSHATGLYKKNHFALPLPPSFFLAAFLFGGNSIGLVCS